MHGDTLLSTPSGQVKIKHFNGGLIYVYNGDSINIGFASSPVKYKSEPLYEIVLENSKSIKCTANHKFLTCNGWIKLCELGDDCLILQPREFSFYHPQRYYAVSRLKSLADALHCFRIVLGFLYHYLMDLRQYGVPPLREIVTYLDVIQELADEQQHIVHVLTHTDVQGIACNDAHLKSLFHPSILAALQESAGKNYGVLGNCIGEISFELLSVFYLFSRISQQSKILDSQVQELSRQILDFCMMKDQSEIHQIVSDILHCGVDDNSYCTSISNNCNVNHHFHIARIKSITKIGEMPFYDIFVPFFNNYIANGMIHHNSSKSWTIAQFLLITGAAFKKRILCTREVQNSIKDSVHKLLSDQIEYLNLSGRYIIQRDTILGYNGTEFLFKGLHRNDQDIKSTEGIDLCWIEEAQSVSRDSLKTLIPTIRKDGSQIIFSYNPLHKDDPVHTDYTTSGRDDVLAININYNDNPFFPDVLRREMEWDRAHDIDKYLHVWEGQPLAHSQAQVFYGKWSIQDFEIPDDAIFYYGADWGFSQDPACLIRCFIIDNNLYVCDESYGVGIDMDYLPGLFDKVPLARQYTITADSARPETISHLNKKFGFNIRPAIKGPGSVQDGISFLRSFGKIIIHPSCKHIIDEMKFYSYKTDKLTGDILPVLIDAHNHGIDALRYALEKLMKNISDDVFCGIA